LICHGSYHAEVASLSAPEADALLDEAEANDWSLFEDESDSRTTTILTRSLKSFMAPFPFCRRATTPPLSQPQTGCPEEE
jgi:hypothetical protein